MTDLIGLNCPDCGKKISERDDVCPHCGADLNAPLGQLKSYELARPYIEKARRSVETGRGSKAGLAAIESALEYVPEDAEANNLRGLLLDSLGRVEEAAESYGDALQFDPSLVDARENLEDARQDIGLERFPASGSESRETTGKRSRLNLILAGVIVLLVLLSILGLAGYALQDYFIRVPVVFEPDYTRIGSFDPSVLEETARIMTERAHVWGYAGVKFKVTDDDRIAGSLPERKDVVTFAERITPIGLIEFVDMGTTSLPEGSLIRTDFESPYLPQAEGPVWHTIMTNREIAETSVYQSQFGDYQIAFELTGEGTQILAEHTANFIGSYLAIVIDKRVISTPRIESAITEGSGVIQGGFTNDSANQLAALVGMSPLPIPVRLVEE